MQNTTKASIADDANTLLYFSYGSGKHRLEIAFSVLSALRFRVPGDQLRIVIYTDDPSYFVWLGVELHEVTTSELQDWLGGADYIHRRKSMCLLDAVERYGGNVCFIDSDTYFRASPIKLFGRIGPGRTVLHVRESRARHSRIPWERDLYEQLKTSRLSDLDGRPVDMIYHDAMWNSGVIGLHYTDARLLREAVNLIDQLWQIERSFSIEQFASGFVFDREAKVSPTRDVVFHYWKKDVRDPFGDRLPSLLEQHKGETALTLADRIYRERPTLGFKGKAVEIVRETLRSLGFAVPGAIKSH